MKILVINCGSSSMKYKLFDMDTNNVIASGLAERITMGVEGSFLFEAVGKQKVVLSKRMDTHKDAIDLLFKMLTDKDCGIISDLNEIYAVGHRVLHGGNKYAESILIDQNVKDAIEDCIPLGPLHNPANLMGIEACEKALPNIKQVAVFDTAFHQTMPSKAFIYAIPYEYYEKYAIRKYGFHGTSHRFIAKRMAEIYDKKELKLIICHLGNGASISAVKNGECVETSMGLTPLDGLIMGTRSGNIDAAIVKFLCDNEKLTVDEVDSILNKKSGILGLSGISNDFRDVEKAMQEGNERANLALSAFYYRVATTIGAYITVLGGADAIVFTAGVGENSQSARQQIINYFDYCNIKLDEQKNTVRGSETLISTSDSLTDVWVVPTNEELMIALDTLSLTTQ